MRTLPFKKANFVINTCLFLALIATFIPRMLPNSDWLAAGIGTICALTALGVLFYRRWGSGVDESVNEAVPEALQSKETSDWTRPQWAPDWEVSVGGEQEHARLLARHSPENVVLWNQDVQNVFERSLEKIPETARLKRLSESFLPEDERTVTVTVGKITVKIGGDEVRVTTAGKSPTEETIVAESKDEIVVPASPRIIN